MRGRISRHKIGATVNRYKINVRLTSGVANYALSIFGSTIERKP